MQEMSHVRGAESAGSQGFFQGGGHLLGAIGAQQCEQFLQLTEERLAGIGHTA